MEQVRAFAREFLAGYQPFKRYWNYEDGCVLKGCADLYRATGEESYRRFVLDYLQSFVQPDGSIPNYEMRQYNIDSINCGKALFFGLDETGDARYRQAIEFHMQRLREHPRCECGNFWHKSIYPNQIWLDGLYMAQPFYMAYEMRFGGMANVSDITRQFANVRKYLWNAEKGLHYHACDCAREQPWANPQTGCSPNFWLRSIGWHLMALVDCVELCTETLYEHRQALVELLREALRGVLAYQDARTGLLYQVVDHPEAEGNYLETSGSAMVAYTLMKAARLGAINPEKYAPIGRAMLEHLVSEKLKDGHLTDICAVAGLSDTRDGSVAYYLSEPRVSDDSKGVGPFLMAWAEYRLGGEGA